MAEDRILTTKAAGELLAKLKGRPTPFKSSTVRRWINEEGLEADGDTGERLSIREGDLIEWAKDSGYLPKDFQGSAADGKPAAGSVLPFALKPVAAAAPDPDEDELDDDQDEDLEDDGDDVELVPCPECGESVAISPDTVMAVCPGCGTTLEVVDEQDAEDDEVEEGDEDDEETDEDPEPEPEEDASQKQGRNPFRWFHL